MLKRSCGKYIDCMHNPKYHLGQHLAVSSFFHATMTAAFFHIVTFPVSQNIAAIPRIACSWPSPAAQQKNSQEVVVLSAFIQETYSLLLAVHSCSLLHWLVTTWDYWKCIYQNCPYLLMRHWEAHLRGLWPCLSHITNTLYVYWLWFSLCSETEDGWGAYQAIPCTEKEDHIYWVSVMFIFLFLRQGSVSIRSVNLKTSFSQKL